MTRGFTQCKTLQTLKVDVLEIPDNKNIGELFSKYELIFLDQKTSQILPWPTETPLQNNPNHVLHRFSYFILPHSTTCLHKYWMYQNICQANQIYY